VTNEVGAPIAGVNVYVRSLNVSVQTGESGRYLLTIPAAHGAATSAVVTARVISYLPKSATIALTSTDTVTQDFTLTANPLRLGEVIVTGAGTSTTRDRLTTTINTVDSSAIRRAMNPQNVVSALSGQVPNVEIRTQAGDPGSSASIHIRGTSSLIGTGQPLFVVDGQPIDNSTEATSPNGAAAAAMSGSVTPNRASDINPNDIESIDILKGSAAAAIYGARAANGVVLITTKRGTTGATRYSWNTTATSDRVDPKIALQTTYGQGDNGNPIATGCGANSANCSANSWGPLLASGTPVYHHEKEIFDTGHALDNNLSISGGSDRTTFYLSGGMTNQDGDVIGPNNKYNRATARLKASHQVSKTLTVGGNFNYIDTRGDYLWKGNSASGLLLGALRTPPEFNNSVYLDPITGRPRSYRFPNPTAAADTLGRGYDNPFFIANVPVGQSELSRYISNVNADWEPLDWLSVKYTLGTDSYTDWRLQGFPRSSSIVSPVAVGRVIRNDDEYLEIDHNLIAVATKSFSNNVQGTFTLGQNLNSRRQRELYVQGDRLVAPLPYALQNTLTFTPTENRALAHISGYFAQAEFTLYNQLFLNLGLRNDGFSTFGPSERRANYPKASIAWDLTRALGDTTQQGLLSYAKLRAAYGETGKEPPLYSSVIAYTNTLTFGSGFADILSSSQSGQGGLTSSPLVGNQALKPERSRESEFGVDLGLFDQRADLSATVYNKRSTDVILPLTVNSSQAGAFSAFINGASITNKGTELTLNTRPYTSKDIAVDLGVQYGRNKGRILSLGGTTTSIASNFNAEGLTGVVGSHTVGYEPGVIRGFDFVRCGRGVRATVAGAGTGIDVDSLCAAEGNGKYVKGALVLGSNGLPIVDPTERVIADPHPKYTMGYNASVKLYNRLSLSTMIDVRKGGQVVNVTRASLERIGTHANTLVRSTTDGQFGKNFLTDVYPNVAGPGVGVAAFTDMASWYNWFQTSGGIAGPLTQFVEDGSFVKLRELAVTYTIDGRFLPSRLGFSSADVRVAGRNLHTWTRYTGLDPEANLAGAQSLTQGIDFYNNPQTRSLVISISLNR